MPPTIRARRISQQSVLEKSPRPHQITPSPERNRNAESATQPHSIARQLFLSGDAPVTGSRKGTRSVSSQPTSLSRKQLFPTCSGKSSSSRSSSRPAPVSPPNRAKSKSFGDDKNQQTSARLRRQLSPVFDSLASVTAPKKKHRGRPKKYPSKAKAPPRIDTSVRNNNESQSTTTSSSSTIPDELIDILKPLGLSRRLRSPKDILQQLDKERRPQRFPRKPRSCKKRCNYNEDSDDEEFNDRLETPLSPRAKASQWPNIRQGMRPAHHLVQQEESMQQKERHSIPTDILMPAAKAANEITATLQQKFLNRSTKKDLEEGLKRISQDDNSNSQSRLLGETTTHPSQSNKKDSDTETFPKLPAASNKAIATKYAPPKPSDDEQAGDTEHTKYDRTPEARQDNEKNSNVETNPSEPAERNKVTASTNTMAKLPDGKQEGSIEHANHHIANTHEVVLPDAETTKPTTNSDAAGTVGQEEPKQTRDETESQCNTILDDGSETPSKAKASSKKKPSSKREKKERKSHRKTSLKTKKKHKKSKVRFAELPTTTTTFSVKIRVSTSVDNKTSGKKHKRHKVAAPQSLSESAVQSIANQITQACIAQASNANTTNIISEDAVQQSSSSESSSSAETPAPQTGSNEEPETLNVQKGTQEPNPESAEGNSFLGQGSKVEGLESVEVELESVEEDDLHAAEGFVSDMRSVTSDLSMPTFVSKQTINEIEARETETEQTKNKKPGQVEVAHKSGGHDIEDRSGATFPQADDDDDDEEVENANSMHKKVPTSQLVEDPPIDSQGTMPNEEPERWPLRRKRLRGSDSLAGSEAQSLLLRNPAKKPRKDCTPSSPRRRTRRLFCNDSLAGSMPETYMRREATPAVALAGATTAALVPKIPTEVTVKEKRSQPDSASQMPIDSADSGEIGGGSSDSVGGDNTPNGSDDVDKSVVTYLTSESSRATSRQKRLTSADGNCGTCFGCLRKFDCMTCDRCIERLQFGRNCRTKYKCLARTCRLIQRRQHLDSLGQLMMMGPTNAEKTQAISGDDGVDDSLSHSNFDSESRASSYGSRSAARRPSRVARYWSQKLKKKRQRGSGSGSLSSFSTSAERNATAVLPAVVSPTKKGRRSGRGRKGKKNPLHEMELPIPCDGSIASLRATKRSLRALVQYDEADQDWV